MYKRQSLYVRVAFSQPPLFSSFSLPFILFRSPLLTSLPLFFFFTQCATSSRSQLLVWRSSLTDRTVSTFFFPNSHFRGSQRRIHVSGSSPYSCNLRDLLRSQVVGLRATRLGATVASLTSHHLSLSQTRCNRIVPAWLPHIAPFPTAWNFISAQFITSDHPQSTCLRRSPPARPPRSARLAARRVSFPIRAGRDAY